MNANGPAPDLGFKGRRVVVTGCASGIGRATARALLDQAKRFTASTSPQPTCRCRPSPYWTCARATAIAAAAGSAAGPVDALFKCAGIPPGRPPLEMMAVNFIGPRHLTEQLAPQMRLGSAIAFRPRCRPT